MVNIYTHWGNPKKLYRDRTPYPVSLILLKTEDKVWQKLKVCYIDREMVLLL